MKRIIFRSVLVMLLCLLIPFAAAAAQEEAQEFSNTGIIASSEGFAAHGYLFDGRRAEGMVTGENANLVLHHDAGIGSLYLTFQTTYAQYRVEDVESGKSHTVTDGYIHGFVDLTALFGTSPKTVKVTFESGPAPLFELRVFGEGQVPAEIQKWEVPKEDKTDLMLFAAHSDDDQLYFAGLLPYYAVERGYQVQVVYLTDHYNTYPYRVQELLDGLWAVGIRSYPVLGGFTDFYLGLTVEDAFERFAKEGYDREAMVGFVVEQLRRFKPLVVVGHDFEGESGHIQHKAYAQMVAEAVAVSGDASAYPELTEQYGTWDVPKTYMHLYKENAIVMDWDQPMEAFDGKTPYEVSRYLGFACHGSQHATWLSYYTSDKAAGITRHSPCEYGLYRTTVGEDVQKNDMFENLVSHAEQDRLAEEEAKRLAEEEAARKEAEAEALRQQQEQEQAEEEEKVVEDARHQRAEATKRAQQEKRTKGIVLCICAIVVLLAAIGAVLFFGRGWE